ncbi:hypothetical protein GCM10009587_31210 [Microbacterium maritypicum]
MSSPNSTHLNTPDESRAPIYLFVDESGTSASDPLTLVGVTAFRDIERAESEIAYAYQRALGDVSLWPNVEKRRTFASVGFHFTEDSESVRASMLGALGLLEFRAYVAYSTNDPSQSTSDKLTTMYGTLLSSVLARYRDSDITLVFEENSEMDPLYGKIWQSLLESVEGLDSARAYVGTKAAPCLAATDYVLGVTRVYLRGAPRDFEENRYVALGANLAYLIDFDDDVHLGGTRHPIL